MVSVVTQVILFDNDWQQVQCLRPGTGEPAIHWTLPAVWAGGKQNSSSVSLMQTGNGARRQSKPPVASSPPSAQNAPTFLSTQLSL